MSKWITVNLKRGQGLDTTKENPIIPAAPKTSGIKPLREKGDTTSPKPSIPLSQPIEPEEPTTETVESPSQDIDSYTYLITYADPSQAERLRRIVEIPSPFPIPLREAQYQQAAKEAWQSLDTAEKHEFGYRYTDWPSIPLEQRKQYYGAEKYFSTISPSQRTQLAYSWLTSHPTEKLAVPTIAPGTLRNIQESATGTIPGVRVSYEGIQKYKDENILDDIATFMITMGRDRRPTYKQAETRLLQSAEYELFYTPEMKAKARSDYFGSLPFYKRAGISLGHATVSAALWPITLPQAVVKQLTGKTQLLPDIAQAYEEARLGPPGVIGPSISEVWFGQDMSNIKEQQKKYPVETFLATLGEVGGLYGGGEGLKLVVSGLKYVYGYSAAKVKFHAPYKLQQLPYQLRFKYSQITGRGMYKPKGITDVMRKPVASYQDVFGEYTHIPITSSAKRFLLTDTGAFELESRLKPIPSYDGSIYDVGKIIEKPPKLATGTPKKWWSTYKDAILLAGDEKAIQTLLLKPDTQRLASSLKTITGAGMLSDVAISSSKAFNLSFLSTVGYALSQQRKQTQSFMPKLNLKFEQMLKPVKASISRSDIARSSARSLIPKQAQSQLSDTLNIQKQLQAQVKSQIQDQTNLVLSMFQPLMKLKTPSKSSDETYNRKVPVRLSGEREKPKRFLEMDQAYNVLVKDRTYVKGKKRYSTRFLKMNKQPLSRMDALSLGSHLVDKSAAATFLVKPTKGTPKKSKLSFGSWDNRSYKFYEKNGRYIEKPTYRIDSGGEKQGITALGILANMQKHASKGLVSTKTSRSATKKISYPGTTKTVDPFETVNREVNKAIKSIMKIKF